MLRGSTAVQPPSDLSLSYSSVLLFPAVNCALLIKRPFVVVLDVVVVVSDPSPLAEEQYIVYNSHGMSRRRVFQGTACGLLYCGHWRLTTSYETTPETGGCLCVCQGREEMAVSHITKRLAWINHGQSTSPHVSLAQTQSLTFFIYFLPAAWIAANGNSREEKAKAREQGFVSADGGGRGLFVQEVIKDLHGYQPVEEDHADIQNPRKFCEWSTLVGVESIRQVPPYEHVRIKWILSQEARACRFSSLIFYLFSFLPDYAPTLPGCLDTRTSD